MLDVLLARIARRCACSVVPCVLVVCLTAAAAPPAPFAWKSVNTQGMGYVTGLVIHPLPPYDIYIRTDVGGAYRFDRDAGRWLPLLDHFGPLQGEVNGVESIAVDPTDPNTVYLAANYGSPVNNASISGEVLVSHNRGLNWAPLGLAAQGVYMGANDGYRGTAGERLAVDPRQPGTVYFASRRDGLWRAAVTGSINAHWTKVAGGLPQSVGAYQGVYVGMTFLVFDASSGGSASGATRTLYMGLYGTGVMASTDGGATWSDTKSNGSVNSYGAQPLRAAIDSDGALYVTFGGGEGSAYGNVGRYQAGTWKDVSPTNPLNPDRWHPGYAGISVDPSATGVIAVTTATSGATYRSNDRGATWKQVLAANPALTNQPAYYAQGPLNWGAALAIDPRDPRRVWETNGYGVIATDDVTAQAPVWSWRMNNLEELCVQGVKVPPYEATSGPPAADLFSVAMDMVGFRHASRDGVPTSTIEKFDWVAQGTGLTYCASRPQYVAFVGWDQTAQNNLMSGISADNGLTWRSFSNSTPFTGGKIAMSATDPNNMVWSPSNAGPRYTLDGGTTWQECMTAGHAMTGSWQLSNAYWAAEVLAPDLVLGGRFYYFDNGNFYVSADNGATWKVTNSKWPQDPHYVLQASVVPNPAQGRDIWMSFKPNGNQSTPFQLIRSTDGGTTFFAVSTVDQCNFVAFGKGNSDASPFLYIHGRANGDPDDAIYKSEDLGLNWTRVSEPRTNQFGAITSLAGDMRTQDLVYVGLGCRGIQYGYGPKSGIRGSDRQASNVVNIASQQGGAIAPGEMITIKTSLPATSPLQVNRIDSSGITASAVNSMQILFDGQPAPIVATVAGEAIATVPYGVAGQDSVAIQLYDQINWFEATVPTETITNGNFTALPQAAPPNVSAPISVARLSLPISVPVAAGAPGIFAGANGSGSALAVNADGRLNSPHHPAAKGSAVIIYLTGSGVENMSVIDGRIGVSPLWAPVQSVQVQFGGVASDSVSASAVPGVIAGLTQVTATVPASAPSGATVPLVITVGGVTSQAGVAIAIQ